jgi:hypothetical protein
MALAKPEHPPAVLRRRHAAILAVAIGERARGAGRTKLRLSSWRGQAPVVLNGYNAAKHRAKLEEI